MKNNLKTLVLVAFCSVSAQGFCIPADGGYQAPSKEKEHTTDFSKEKNRKFPGDNS